ncbi:hypothetical protein [Psychromonas antarctica]|uniref:hypothetical protein n=1 Tax=Psychromonas antarctica TaxID=67573 RepID=UPI001EE88334|nr:hypothetical protein [Psychromonas antarctica]MCG6200530.1 hypothetical protein [Psychromonas antarctica]
MNKAIKAALLSAFIFPGVGHLLLKCYRSATILAATALLASYILISTTIENAMLIVDKIQSGEVAPDIVAITEQISQQTSGSGLLNSDFMSLLLMVTWLVAIIDSYRVGQSQQVS